MSEFRSDITIVGGGIAGLWSAKELLDRGLSVSVIEKANCLASGATTRNEGWLHAGTYHATAIYDESVAEQVVGRTVYGHDEIVNFAPESIEHGQSYALFSDTELVQATLARWAKFNIPHREVPKSRITDQGISPSETKATFAVRDKSVNSRVIVDKLARYVIESGGRIITNAHLIPTSDTTADLVADNERHRLDSEVFLVTAGVGTKEIFEKVTDRPFPMRYFKSHLLVTPRISQDNIFSMEPLQAGMMHHGAATVVGINREAVRVDNPSCDVIPERADVVRAALARLMPRLAEAAFDKTYLDVACVKTDITDGELTQYDVSPTTSWQDLNIKVSEPSQGWICAIPGKMTEAPALACAVADYIIDREPIDSIHKTHDETFLQAYPQVNLRPADQWMAERQEQAI